MNNSVFPSRSARISSVRMRKRTLNNDVPLTLCPHRTTCRILEQELASALLAPGNPHRLALLKRLTATGGWTRSGTPARPVSGPRRAQQCWPWGRPSTRSCGSASWGRDRNRNPPRRCPSHPQWGVMTRSLPSHPLGRRTRRGRGRRSRKIEDEAEAITALDSIARTGLELKEWCRARDIDLLAPNGLGVFLIPSGFLTGTSAQRVTDLLFSSSLRRRRPSGSRWNNAEVVLVMATGEVRSGERGPPAWAMGEGHALRPESPRANASPVGCRRPGPRNPE